MQKHAKKKNWCNFPGCKKTWNPEVRKRYCQLYCKRCKKVIEIKCCKTCRKLKGRLKVAKRVNLNFRNFQTFEVNGRYYEGTDEMLCEERPCPRCKGKNSSKICQCLGRGKPDAHKTLYYVHGECRVTTQPFLPLPPPPPTLAPTQKEYTFTEKPLGLDLNDVGNKVVVVKVINQGAAYRQGIVEGSQLLSVNKLRRDDPSCVFTKDSVVQEISTAQLPITISFECPTGNQAPGHGPTSSNRYSG